jgi:hypothetical protein
MTCDGSRIITAMWDEMLGSSNPQIDPSYQQIALVTEMFFVYGWAKTRRSSARALRGSIALSNKGSDNHALVVTRRGYGRKE